MAVTIEEATRWHQDYGRAWETGDADLIVTLFTENASYRETPFDVPMIGHEAIRAYWLDQPGNHRDVHFTFEIWGVVGDQCFSHWHTRFEKDHRKRELDGAFRLIFQQAPGGALKCRILEEWWHQRQTG
ncbi:MAG: nuclear transport factor 2 family protein [Pseudomonadota bacterium]